MCRGRCVHADAKPGMRNDGPELPSDNGIVRRTLARRRGLGLINEQAFRRIGIVGDDPTVDRSGNSRDRGSARGYDSDGTGKWRHTLRKRSGSGKRQNDREE